MPRLVAIKLAHHIIDVPINVSNVRRRVRKLVASHYDITLTLPIALYFNLAPSDLLLAVNLFTIAYSNHSKASAAYRDFGVTSGATD